MEGKDVEEEEGMCRIEVLETTRVEREGREKEVRGKEEGSKTIRRERVITSLEDRGRSYTPQ